MCAHAHLHRCVQCMHEYAKEKQNSWNQSLSWGRHSRNWSSFYHQVKILHVSSKLRKALGNKQPQHFHSLPSELLSTLRLLDSSSKEGFYSLRWGRGGQWPYGSLSLQQRVKPWTQPSITSLNKEALFPPEISGASLVFCKALHAWGWGGGVRSSKQWQDCLFSSG